MGSEDSIEPVSTREKEVTKSVLTMNGIKDGSSKNSLSSEDAEKQAAAEPLRLQRKLKSRHLQMIAIGGTIGTGLFIGSGGALATAGPVGALIAYMFIGTVVYSVMVSMGEMATYIPVTGAFTSYATRFIDPSLGFAMGWIYWFSWAMTFALELTATGLIIQYWNKDLSVAIFISVFWVFITAINCFPVDTYGEIEFWFSSIKVVTVMGFLIFSICIDAGAGAQGYLGFKTWSNPGAFAPYLLDQVNGNNALAKFAGFAAVLIKAAFSYQGTELVGIAAGETENPRKNVPTAIKKTFYRILIFFVFTIFFIGLLIPYDYPDLLNAANDFDATASPFVIAAKLAGVKVLPGLINAILLTVVLSAANSNVFSGSRILLGLAQEGFAPAVLRRVSRGGVPYPAVACTSAFGLLAFMNLSTNGGTVFNWFMDITAVAGMITWACINGCHIAFMRALAVRGISRDNLPYKALWQPWFAWYGLIFNILIILTNGFTAFMPWNTSDFFASYVSIIIFVVFYAGHKAWYRQGFVGALEADLTTGCIEQETEEWSITIPTTWWGKAWAWLC